MRIPCTAMKNSPRSPQLEKARVQQRRPNTARKKERKKGRKERDEMEGRKERKGRKKRKKEKCSLHVSGLERLKQLGAGVPGVPETFLSF